MRNRNSLDLKKAFVLRFQGSAKGRGTRVALGTLLCPPHLESLEGDAPPSVPSSVARGAVSGLEFSDKL